MPDQPKFAECDRLLGFLAISRRMTCDTELRAWRYVSVAAFIEAIEERMPHLTDEERKYLRQHAHIGIPL